MINGPSQVDTKTLENLGLNLTHDVKKKELGQEEFLALLVAQLKNQNPMEPQDGAEFIGQMAQFGTLDSIQKMSNSMESLSSSFRSSQALQASSMVGRKVRIESDTGLFDGSSNLEGVIKLDNSVGNLKVQIEDMSGQTVKELSLGTQKAGDLMFNWNGLDDNGEGVAPGFYRIKALGTVDGDNQAFTTYVSANVDSVTLGNNKGVTLNLAGFGERKLSEIKELQ